MNRGGRLVAALAAIATFGVFALASCGGYSDEDADTFCKQEAAALGACFTEKVRAECLDCYKECGSDCNRRATCPETYTCDE